MKNYKMYDLNNLLSEGAIINNNYVLNEDQVNTIMENLYQDNKDFTNPYSKVNNNTFECSHYNYKFNNQKAYWNGQLYDIVTVEEKTIKTIENIVLIPMNN